MKKSNYYLIVMLSIMGLLTMGSCSLLEQDLCADITCENGGSCDEGICDCPDGFLGDNCESFDPTQVQALLDGGQSPKALFDGGVSLDSLYGKMYESGLIFYLDTDDGTGMVAAAEDQSTGVIWGCLGTDISGLVNAIIFPIPNPETEEGARIGDGATNTSAILDGCNPNDEIAAKLCREIGEEWFLPSRGELNLMYTNLYLNSYGGFAVNWYWSSTEYAGNLAWSQYFTNDGYQDVGNKNSISRPVRAARTF